MAFSNGFLSVYGNFWQSNNTVSYTVTFAMSFSNTSYKIFVCPGINRITADGQCYNYNKTVSTCGIISIGLSGYTTSWMAIGY